MKSFNGWTNRETWNVHLILFNEPYYLRRVYHSEDATELEIRASYLAMNETRGLDMEKVNWQEIFDAILEFRGDYSH